MPRKQQRKQQRRRQGEQRKQQRRRRQGERKAAFLDVRVEPPGVSSDEQKIEDVRLGGGVPPTMTITDGSVVQTNADIPYELQLAQLIKTMYAGDTPERLAAQYPDLLMDPYEHAQLFKTKYAGVFTGFGLPNRVEAMRTKQWGELDLGTVLSCETFMEMADVNRIKRIRVELVSKDNEPILFNEIDDLRLCKIPFISPEGWNRDGGICCSHECRPDDRFYCPIVFNVPEKQANMCYMCYTVEWRSGAVTLMPIDLVKVHLYTELPPAPWWLDSRPGVTVCRQWQQDVVPEHAVVERWHICEEQARARETFEAFFPPVYVFKVS